VACIAICSVEDMPGVVARLQPARVVSLLTGNAQPATPPEVQSEDHLRILVDDIEGPEAGFIAPSEAHVEQLIAFLRASPPHVSIVIHCLAGVSRSPAAALVALALDAPGQEMEAAALLRAAAPFADPNRLIIELADVSLGRNGALVAALDSMGESDWLRGVKSFTLPRSLHGFDPSRAA
jgi:predicted protein tyrosine phosphatase